MYRRRSVVLPLILLLIASAAFAQRGGRGSSSAISTSPRTASRSAAVTIHVTFENDRPVQDSHLQVELLSSGAPVQTSFVNSEGVAQFNGVAVGMAYSVRISGPGVETTTAGFDVSAFEMSHIEYVAVRQANVAGSGRTSKQPTVAAVDLNAPAKAKGELSKGNEAVQHKDYAGAVKHYRKAIEHYPQYAGAYSNLGVVCMATRDFGCAREAFEATTRLNPHSAIAFFDLGRLKMMENRFADAEPLLRQSLAVDPQNPEALTLMANAELVLGKYDQAVLFAHKVHALPEHRAQAAAHYIAGRALEAQREPQQAEAEYKMLLEEAPDNALAKPAREAVERLSASAAAAAPR